MRCCAGDHLAGAGVAILLLLVEAWFLLLLLFSVTVNFGFGKLIIDGGLSRPQSRGVSGQDLGKHPRPIIGDQE
jgi:hypothetical protein